MLFDMLNSNANYILLLANPGTSRCVGPDWVTRSIARNPIILLRKQKFLIVEPKKKKKTLTISSSASISNVSRKPAAVKISKRGIIDNMAFSSSDNGSREEFRFHGCGPRESYHADRTHLGFN